MDKYQYRITINNSQSQITDKYPGDQWSKIAEIQQSRGFHAILEFRLITDHSILSMLTSLKGYLTLKDRVICPWEVLAELY